MSSVNPKCFFDIVIGKKPVGRMVFELFADVVPETAENFRCLCTGERGLATASRRPLHFKNSIFHRVIPGFMAQGGDFTNFNGTGGESIYGPKFKDENFEKKHAGRGILSMANCGRHTNGSQFFLTFQTTAHLDRKHVVFGKLVEGNDVLTKIEQTRTGPQDRPIDEVRVIDCGEVINATATKAASHEELVEEQSRVKSLITAVMNKGKVSAKKGPSAPKPAPAISTTAVSVAADGEIDISDVTTDDNDKNGTTSSGKGGSVEEGYPPEPPKDPRQRKLWEIKMKLAAARKQNTREVTEEKKRFQAGDSKKAVDHHHDDNKDKDGKEKTPVNPELIEDPLMFETAEVAAMRAKKGDKKKGGAAAFGWDVFNQDTLYRAYKSRLKNVQPNADKDKIFRDANSLDYASNAQPTQGAIDHMVSELEQTAARRAKFSRRRGVNEDADIDSINERNRVFNKKVKRAFDQYTQEIKANIERGTAL